MSKMELCDLACPITTNLPSISITLPPKIRITPNSIQDAHDWRILYHLRSTTRTLDPARVPPLKLKIKRRKTFRVLNVIPASTFTSTPDQVQEAANQVQEAAKQQTDEVVQLYSHRHGTVISCQGQMCQTLNWKRKWKWRSRGGAVDVRGYGWQSLRREEHGHVATSTGTDEKRIAPTPLDDRGEAKGKTMRPGTWIPFSVKREKGSEIWYWASIEMTSGLIGSSAGGDDEEETAALMEEGRLEFVSERLAEQEKRQILLTAVAITEWERWGRRPAFAQKARQRILRLLCLTA